MVEDRKIASLSAKGCNWRRAEKARKSSIFSLPHPPPPTETIGGVPQIFGKNGALCQSRDLFGGGGRIPREIPPNAPFARENLKIFSASIINSFPFPRFQGKNKTSRTRLLRPRSFRCRLEEVRFSTSPYQRRLRWPINLRSATGGRGRVAHAICRRLASRYRPATTSRGRCKTFPRMASVCSWIGK
jgi:hypothetical protein